MAENVELMEEKLVPLGYVVIQSKPVTELEGEILRIALAKILPETFTSYSWLPIIPGESN